MNIYFLRFIVNKSLILTKKNCMLQAQTV